MKKNLLRSSIVSLIVLVIAWIIMGIKLLNNNYEIIIEAYIALVAHIVSCVSVIGYKFTATK